MTFRWYPDTSGSDEPKPGSGTQRKHKYGVVYVLTRRLQYSARSCTVSCYLSIILYPRQPPFFMHFSITLKFLQIFCHRLASPALHVPCDSIYISTQWYNIMSPKPETRTTNRCLSLLNRFVFLLL